MILAGTHAVAAALEMGRRQHHRLLISRDNQKVAPIVALAESQGLPVDHLPAKEIAERSGLPDHQGIALETSPLPEDTLEGYLSQCGEDSLILGLDQIQDPRNLGAICRSLVGLGFQWLLLGKDRTAPLSALAAKASVGALEHTRIVRVGNMAQALKTLQETHWVWGADGAGESTLGQMDFAGRQAIILGQEDKGLRPLVLKRCHGSVRIALSGKVESLNIATAAALFLHEARRKRENVP